MTAQEWLTEYNRTRPYGCDAELAATIIRAQQDRIEMLELAVYRACEELSLRKCSPDCSNNKKCAVITMVSRGNCRAHWHKWLMGGNNDRN